MKLLVIKRNKETGHVVGIDSDGTEHQDVSKAEIYTSLGEAQSTADRYHGYVVDEEEHTFRESLKKRTEEREKKKEEQEKFNKILWVVLIAAGLLFVAYASFQDRQYKE